MYVHAPILQIVTKLITVLFDPNRIEIQYTIISENLNTD